MRCCICGREIVGREYSPRGSLKPDYTPKKWEKGSKCCYMCYREYVITGRAYTASKLKWKSKGAKR